MDKFDFNGKKVLVTGASSGVGREVAVLLSKMGAKVVIVARRESELKKTLSLMEGNIHSYRVLDLADFDKVVETVKELVLVDGQKFDCIAYCAGLGIPVPLRLITEENINDIFRVNFIGFAAVLKCVASKRYFSDGGAVVAISSVTATLIILPKTSKSTHPNIVKHNITDIISIKLEKSTNDIYAASKGALNSLVLSAAKELRNKKIRINAILPSTINTEMIRNQNLTTIDKSMLDNDNEFFMKPLYVATVVVALLSDSMKYVSGALINVDRGDNTWG